MAITVNYIEITSSSIKIQLRGLPTERIITIQTICWDQASSRQVDYDYIETYLYSPVDYYTFEFTGLEANTWYDWRAVIKYSDDTLIDWINQSQKTSDISPSGNEKFYCSSTATTITATVNNLNQYDSITYSLYDSSQNLLYRETVYTTTNTFSNLTGLTQYYVSVWYSLNGNSYDIYDTQARLLCPIMTGEGGGGGNWRYNNISISINQSYSSNSYSFGAQDGLLFIITTNTAGTIQLQSSYPYGNRPLISYFGLTNNSYNPSTGQPYSYNNSDTGSFNYSYTSSNNQTYYLWVTSEDDGGFDLQIYFSSSGGEWSYSYTNTNSSVTFNVSYPGANNYYFTYRVGTYSGGYNIYDTDTYYGQHESVSSKTINNLNLNTTYYINVGYSNSLNGTVIWLGEQIFTTGGGGTNGYVYIFNGTSWKKAIPYIFDGTSWRQVQAYVFNGSQWKKCIQ